MRPIDVDLDAARLAVEAADAPAFATAIAPLGVDLTLSVFRPFVTRAAATEWVFLSKLALGALYRAIVDDAGVAMERERPGSGYVALAVRLDDRVVLGITYGSSKDPYGWKSLRRWYKDTSRNRDALVAWATTEPPPYSTISIPMRAVERPVHSTSDRDEEAALLAGVLAAPDDDAPRLVYADWLIERGDPRGEFIQLQCAPSTLEIAQRLESVTKLCAPAFDDMLDGASYTTSRGFVDTVRMPASTLARKWKALLAKHPIRELNIVVKNDEQLFALAELGLPKRIGLFLIPDENRNLAIENPAARPLFEGRTHLCFGGLDATGMQWLTLLASAACANVQHLDIRTGAAPTELVEILGDHAIVPDLAWLYLDGRFEGPLTEAVRVAAESLGARPKLAYLAGLSWNYNDAPALYAALFARSSFVELDYRHTLNGEALLTALAQAPSSRTLRKVAINGYRAKNARAIHTASPYLTECILEVF